MGNPALSPVLAPFCGAFRFQPGVHIGPRPWNLGVNASFRHTVPYADYPENTVFRCCGFAGGTECDSRAFCIADGGMGNTVPQKRPPLLTELPCRDASSGDFRVVIETPRRSRNKYRYEPECGTLLLASMLPEGMSFPYDFGFIPSTLADDGDPLDVLVLMDEPSIPLAIIRARLIGAIRAEQKERGGGWKENDRLVAVACHAHSHSDETSLKSLKPHLIDEIIEFFREYNRQHGKQFRSTGLSGPRRAGKIVESGERRFRRRKN